MKKKDWNEGLNHIDEDLVEEYVTKSEEIDKKRRKIAEKNTGLVGELVRGIRDIKVLNANENFMSKAKSRLREANEENYKMEKVRMN